MSDAEIAGPDYTELTQRVCAPVGRALCDRRERCGCAARPDCEERERARCATWLRCRYWHGSPRGSAIDPQRLEACLAAARAPICSPLRQIECTDLLVDEAREGEPCRSPELYAFCLGGRCDADRVCVAEPPPYGPDDLDAPCTMDEDCAAALTCREGRCRTDELRVEDDGRAQATTCATDAHCGEGSWRCARAGRCRPEGVWPLGSAGASCSASQDCGENLDCERGSCRALSCSAGPCIAEATVAEGDDCSDTPCEPGTHCAVHARRCLRERGFEEPCDAALGGQCALGLACEPNYPTGRCALVICEEDADRNSWYCNDDFD